MLQETKNAFRKGFKITFKKERNRVEIEFIRVFIVILREF